MDIREIVARRTDLGTFLVHLTRGDTPRENLQQILAARQIEARNPFGQAIASLQGGGLPTASQRCVCFTETPLEHTHLLLAEIDLRAIQLQPYGIALPKKMGRAMGINPVWYLDMSPGPHEWLTRPFNSIIDSEIAAGTFAGSDIEKLAPFVEQMGTNRAIAFRKEFWWEREWRIRGHFVLPHRVIVLCPEEEMAAFGRLVAESDGRLEASFVDPRWGLEQIIARLAQFSADDTDML